MKRFKRQLAVALMTAMMVSSISFSGAAANNGEWKLNEEGEWNYWENGDILYDQMIRVGSGEKTRTYYVKEDGNMASDELFEWNNGDGGIGYAEPDGRLARGWWEHLDEDGHLSPALEEGSWYYFDKNGKRLENTTKEINKDTYAFDESGKMLSEEFLEDGKKYYFEHDGQMAKDKWLYIKGNWYRFKSDGSCWIASDEKATGSNASKYLFDEEGILTSDNAPSSSIDSIEVKGDAGRNALIGKEVKITFPVNLASDSNATKAPLTKDHDFWVEKEYSQDSYFAGQTTDVDYDNNEYTIGYIMYAPSEFKVRAMIDGVESEWITITSDWGENADNEKAKAVENILSDDLSTADKVKSIKVLRESLEDGSLFKKIWLDKMADLMNLDESNAMENRNVIKTDSSEVESLLRKGSLNLVGASLNAEQGDKITLSATEGERVNLPESYAKQVPIELNFYKNDVETSELEIPVIVSIPIPQGINSDGLKVYHMNGVDGSAELLDIKIEGNQVSFATDGFSNFVFAGKAEGSNNSGGSSGGGSSSSGGGSSSGFSTNKKSDAIKETSGQWNHTEKGWQFKKTDGSVYVNTWIYTKAKWYWIEPDGFMAQGWKELNGKKYYLVPTTGEMQIGWILDGQTWYYTDETGAVKTGWVNVGGKWYYLSEDGRMLFSVKTPDGYQVDENGAWIQ